jgi:hypothetical protein
MEENHKLEIERLINLKKTMKSDVKSMEQMFSLYMNEKISICSFCAAQIKMAQKRLYNWYSSQINNIPPPPSITDEKPKVGCQSCKQKGRPKK